MKFFHLSDLHLGRRMYEFSLIDDQRFILEEIVSLAEKEHPGLKINTARAEGLRECKKLVAMARAGKYSGYLLEGMACPGGCVAGAGTILPVEKAKKLVEKYSAEAAAASPLESAYRDRGENLD